MAARTSKHVVDVFEDTDDESNTFSLENRTWKKLEEQRHKDGYRDGVDIGEDATLQAGHDVGFQQTSFIFHLTKMCGSIAAMRSCLSLSDIDENAIASLKVDMDCLEDKMQKLEQQWIDSVLSSPAAHNSQHHHHHCSQQNFACQHSANCDRDEVTAADSDCRHLSDISQRIDKTSHVDESQPVDADLSVCTRTTKVDESGLVDLSLCGRMHDSDSQNSFNHGTVEATNSTCQQLVEHHGPVKTMQSTDVDDCDRLGVKRTAMKTCESVDQCLLESVSDRQCLAQYKSCCSQLEQLMQHFQSVTHT